MIQHGKDHSGAGIRVGARLGSAGGIASRPFDCSPTGNGGLADIGDVISGAEKEQARARSSRTASREVVIVLLYAESRLERMLSGV